MVLNNRRMYADLKSKLLLGDIDRQRRLQQQWKTDLDAWKLSHVEVAVNKFQYDSLLFTSVSHSPSASDVRNIFFKILVLVLQNKRSK